MSVGFKAILWNKQKKWYDVFIISAILLYLITYFTVNAWLFPTITFETMLIRSFGTLAIILLHVILSIGPLSRLNKKFLVLLYNRRHLGVAMFLMASVHALFSIFQFHANGNIHPLISIFLSNTHYDSFIYFPFQTLGFAAYLILMVMAFTSHDFWLKVFSPRIWKMLHMFVYLAYFLLVLHILLGVIQLESSSIYFVMLLLGVLWLGIIHVYAACLEDRFDNVKKIDDDSWVRVCTVDEIEDSKAKMIFANGERIAVFKYGNQLSAVHNVCKHQNGPLGEGKIVDGCITCPWHGYQYQPSDGCAPAPFTEKIATYQTKIIGRDIWILSSPLPEGTFTEPAIIPDMVNTESDHTNKGIPFYIGWQPNANKVFRLFARKAVVIIISVALLCAFLISFNQQFIAKSYFTENPPKYEGQLVAYPFPALRTIQKKNIFGNPVIKTYPLVNAWKFGAMEVVSDFIKKHGIDPFVQIQGVTIESDGIQVIQLTNGEESISCGLKDTGSSGDSLCCQPKNHSIDDAVLLKNSNNPITKVRNNEYFPQATKTYIGEIKLTGEIIDPKCYFGAMNPGFGKPHRSCAVRCIEGGIMPMMQYKDENGKNAYAIILDENGGPVNSKIGYAIAEPLQLIGQMFTMDNWKFIKVNIPSGLLRFSAKKIK